MEINYNILNKFLRASLRVVPFIPAPELYDIFEALKDSNKDIASKIDKAHNSLKETSDLIDDLQKDLLLRTENVKHLKEEYERYAKLSEIEFEKVKPLLEELDKTVNKNRSLDRLIGIGINVGVGIVIFILGIWIGPKITEWIN